MTLEFPIVAAAVKAIFGKEKPVATPAESTLVFDSRDVAICCLSAAVMFCVLAVIFLAARQPVARVYYIA